jgi:hypothetical protein
MHSPDMPANVAAATQISHPQIENVRAIPLALMASISPPTVAPVKCLMRHLFESALNFSVRNQTI